MSPPHDSIRMLQETRQRTASLLADLLRQHSELDTSPPDIHPSDLAQGRKSIQTAITATRKMLQSLDEALQTAHHLSTYN